MTLDLPFQIYVYLNSIIALDDRTAAGVANAMRISKDTASNHLRDMVAEGLLTCEKVGKSNVHFIASVMPAQV